MRDHSYYIYILSNPSRSVYYIGFTQSLTRRLDQHIANKVKQNNFASKYNCGDVIYYEMFKYVNEAIARERQLKKWKREKKTLLIKKWNPEMKTLNLNFVESDE